MPDPREMHDLASFATALADELPGQWHSAYGQHDQHTEQFARAEDVWDLNHVSEAIATHELGHDAVLTRDDGARLYVIGRPHQAEEYLVAAMAPRNIDPEVFRGVSEPHGIIVPDDPFQAADDVSVDLLPRYDKALAQVQHNADAAPQRKAQEAGTEQVVVLTWTGDGELVARPDSQEAVVVLGENGFVYDEQHQAYVLSGDDTAVQARFVRAAGAQLSAHGISVVMRHPSPTPALNTTSTAPSVPVKTAARTR
ncbi:hypothetical protein [Streptomyces sp. SID1121]|uniref:hypothetical protein n=1 Tax=Streptomyces sp. SID1121 TaxID=3425888 RepID=UPI0040567E04